MKYLPVALLFLILPVQALAMERPVFGVNKQATAPSALRFGYFEGNPTGLTTSDVGAREPIAAPGTIGDLTIDTSGIPPGLGTSYAFVLMKNGVATALTCTVSDTTTTGCSDHVDTVSVVAGDTVSWRDTPTGTPLALTIDISSSFTSTNADETDVNGYTNATDATKEAWLPMYGGIIKGAEASSSTAFPTSGVIDDFRTLATSGFGAAGTTTFAIILNHATSSITCDNGGTIATCSDLTDSISVNQGDLLSIAAFPFGTVNARATAWGYRFRPTVDGEAPIYGSGSSIVGGVTHYLHLAQSMSDLTNENSATTTSPIAFTAKKAYFNGFLTYAAGKSRTIDLRDNAATTSLSVLVQLGNSGADNTNSASVNQGDLINWSTFTTGAPPSNLNWFTLAATSFIDPGTATAATSILGLVHALWLN